MEAGIGVRWYTQEKKTYHVTAVTISHLVQKERRIDMKWPTQGENHTNVAAVTSHYNVIDWKDTKTQHTGEKKLLQQVIKGKQESAWNGAHRRKALSMLPL